MNRTRSTRWLICVSCVLALTACGGNNETSINGSLSRLNAGASVTLQDNGADNLTLSANGPFHFATFVPGGRDRHAVHSSTTGQDDGTNRTTLSDGANGAALGDPVLKMTDSVRTDMLRCHFNLNDPAAGMRGGRARARSSASA